DGRRLPTERSDVQHASVAEEEEEKEEVADGSPVPSSSRRRAPARLLRFGRAFFDLGAPLSILGALSRSRRTLRTCRPHTIRGTPRPTCRAPRLGAPVGTSAPRAQARDLLRRPASPPAPRRS